MPPALAGLLCGAIAGLVFAVLGARAIQGLATDGPGWLRSALEQVGFTKMVLPVALLAHAVWTATGMFLGVAYELTTADGGILTPFTASIVAVSALATASAVIWGGRARLWLVPVPMAAGALFGVGLPLLAG